MIRIAPLMNTNMTSLLRNQRWNNASTLSILRRSFSQTSFVNSTITPVPKKIAPPNEQVPDVKTFLTLIGRKSQEYSENFESWQEFMTATSKDLKGKGIDTRPRKYILSWREKFRKGEELKEIKQGKKSWGGERRRKAYLAAVRGRERAAARENE